MEIYQSLLQIGNVPMVETASNEIANSNLTLTRISLWKILNSLCFGTLIMTEPISPLPANRYEWGKSRERFLRSAFAAHPSSATLEVINHSAVGRPQWEPASFVLYPPLTTGVHLTESKSKRGLQRKCTWGEGTI